MLFTFDFVVALRLDNRSKAREHEQSSLQDDAFVFPPAISDGVCGGAVTRIDSFLMKSCYHSKNSNQEGVGVAETRNDF